MGFSRAQTAPPEFTLRTNAFILSVPAAHCTKMGRKAGQVSLAHAVAREVHGALRIVFFASGSPLTAIAIKADDSLASNPAKAKQRYKTMIQYREDMGVFECTRIINSFRSEFPDLYEGSGLAHFHKR